MTMITFKERLSNQSSILIKAVYISHSANTLGKSMILIILLQAMIGWFHGISTIIGYSMPSPVFKYIINIWFVNLFYRQF